MVEERCLTADCRPALEKYLRTVASDVDSFWLHGKNLIDVDSKWLSLADYIYVKAFLGSVGEVNASSVEYFSEAIANAPIAGKHGCEKTLLPHLSAYVLGALNILDDAGFDCRSSTLNNIHLNIDLLIDGLTKLPRWPRAWSHHTWRVSHWIGGIPSILLTFARHDPKGAISEDLVSDVLNSCDQLVLNPTTGLMQPYKSQLLQQVFRTAYGVRHNPRYGDIGGLAHIHWVNHAMNRDYVSVEQLIARCLEDMSSRPFLEKVPYCLDFDYVQLLRTSLEQRPHLRSQAIDARASEYVIDIVKFLNQIPIANFTLHKLPGALAVLHEASQIIGLDTVPGIKCSRIDIIKKAYWL